MRTLVKLSTRAHTASEGWAILVEFHIVPPIFFDLKDASLARDAIAWARAALDPSNAVEQRRVRVVFALNAA